MNLSTSPFSIRRVLPGLGVAGCAATLGIFALVALIIGVVFFVIFSSFQSSPVYIQAMDAAQHDPRVTSALGSPIQSGWFISGEISEQGLSGDANLVIPISGPRKSGTLYAAARKGNGTWQFYTLAVQVDGSSDIIVLER